MKKILRGRNVVALLALISIVVLFPWVFSVLYDVVAGTPGAKGYTWDDKTQLIAMRRLDATETIFQLSTALLAAIWGMIILGTENAKKVANQTPERIVIGCASILLVYSGLYYLKYTDALIAIQLNAQRISLLSDTDKSQVAFQDILSATCNSNFWGQVLCLLVAASFVAIAIATDLWVFKETEND